MASITKEANGRRTVQFVAPDGKRKSIRLGKTAQRNAEKVKLHVEMIVAATIAGHAVDDETARWLAGLEQPMHDKLAAVGLATKRQAAELSSFIAAYVEERVDVKPATKEVWNQGRNGLVAFLGADRSLRNVTSGDADGYKLHLIGQKLAPYTIRKRLQFAKMIFRAAVRRKLMPSNPFADVNVPAVMSDRQRFITPEETARLLDAAPDGDWRMIIALSRYAGLRCPSEVLSLRWQDVDWQAGRMIVTAPKTEHHPGKGTRVVPIFGDLRPWLEQAYEAAPEGAVYVVDERYRRSANSKSGWRNCNLRTQFERIITRAGLTPWPRLFHNLRSSCETELIKRHPMPAVVAWLGHTEEIALRHYCQVTDADFAQAASHRTPTEPKDDAKKAVQNPVQQPADSSRNASHEESETAVLRGDSSSCETLQPARRMGWDSNPRMAFTINGFQDRRLQPLGHPSPSRRQGRCW